MREIIFKNFKGSFMEPLNQFKGETLLYLVTNESKEDFLTVYDLLSSKNTVMVQPLSKNDYIFDVDCNKILHFSYLYDSLIGDTFLSKIQDFKRLLRFSFGGTILVLDKNIPFQELEILIESIISSVDNIYVDLSKFSNPRELASILVDSLEDNILHKVIFIGVPLCFFKNLPKRINLSYKTILDISEICSISNGILTRKVIDLNTTFNRLCYNCNFIQQCPGIFNESMNISYPISNTDSVNIFIDSIEHLFKNTLYRSTFKILEDTSVESLNDVKKDLFKIEDSRDSTFKGVHNGRGSCPGEDFYNVYLSDQLPIIYNRCYRSIPKMNNWQFDESSKSINFYTEYVDSHNLDKGYKISSNSLMPKKSLWIASKFDLVKEAYKKINLEYLEQFTCDVVKKFLKQYIDISRITQVGYDLFIDGKKFLYSEKTLLVENKDDGKVPLLFTETTCIVGSFKENLNYFSSLKRIKKPYGYTGLLDEIPNINLEDLGNYIKESMENLLSYEDSITLR